MSLIKKCIVCFLLINSCGFAQKTFESQFFEIHYNANWTAADLASRYGYLNNIGAGVHLRTRKSFTIGLETNLIFGNRFRNEFDSVFSHLIDSYNNITDINGDIARVLVYSRGFYGNLDFGKLVSLNQVSKKDFLWIQFGVGFLQHRFRIETNSQVVPQIEQEYRKGYDRYTSGLNFSQSLSYALMPEERYYNFYAGFYVQEGLTYNRREINFDQPNTPVSKDLRLDIQIGIRLGWIIPFYSAEPKDYYFE